MKRLERVRITVMVHPALRPMMIHVDNVVYESVEWYYFTFSSSFKPEGVVLV